MGEEGRAARSWRHGGIYDHPPGHKCLAVPLNPLACSGPKAGLQKAAALALVSEAGAQPQSGGRCQLAQAPAAGFPEPQPTEHGRGGGRRPALLRPRALTLTQCGLCRDSSQSAGGLLAAPVAGVDLQTVSLRACGWALTVRWQDVVVEAGPLAEAPGLTPSLRAAPSCTACLAGGRGGMDRTSVSTVRLVAVACKSEMRFHILNKKKRGLNVCSWEIADRNLLISAAQRRQRRPSAVECR